jgi:Flp pilus assembly protein CpaB
VISACLGTTAVWFAVSAFVPQPTPTGLPTVVVSKDLIAGQVLTTDDLAVARWPSQLRPRGAVADPHALVGRALSAGMSRGEAVTQARVRGPGLLAGVRTGLVAAHVRLADPAMAAMAAAGDHIDLISSSGKLAAADVTVLAVDAGPAGGSGVWAGGPESGQPSGVIVAVAGDDALRLATVDPSGVSEVTFSLVLREPGS